MNDPIIESWWNNQPLDSLGLILVIILIVLMFVSLIVLAQNEAED